jgi:hypothetical protein
LPDDFLSIRRVTRDYYVLTELSVAALDSRGSEWEVQSGLPTYYFINFSTRGVIGFAPFPETSSDTGTIRIDYYSYSTDLSNDTDKPFDGYKEFEAYSYALVYYAAYKCSLIDERDNLANVFISQYQAIMTIGKNQCINMPNYAPSLVGSKK